MNGRRSPFFPTHEQMYRRAPERNPAGLIGCLVLGLLAATAGCREEDPPPEDLGTLPGLAGTTHPALRDEYQRIVEEKGTPAQLVSPEPPPVAQNAAAVLRKLFTRDKAEYVFGKTVEVFPVGKFEFRDPSVLQKAIRLRTKYDGERERAREAVARRSCDFVIPYTEGFGADLSFVKGVRTLAHLEAFLAAEHLRDGDLAAALEAVEAMFRLAECLAGERHPTARLGGATVRMEALAVVQAMVAQAGLKRSHLDRLYGLVQSQLGSWPDDADAWIADRALGMHAFEIVRKGRAMDLLTEKEAERFFREGVLDTLNSRSRHNADEDEWYYLKTMRTIIAGCARPYHERIGMFEDLLDEQHEMRDSEAFPFVAARMLLPAVQAGHAMQARERANCEAWAIALALATGRPAPPFRINPLTGGEYRVEQAGGRVVVHNMGPDGQTQIVVPVLAGTASKPPSPNVEQPGT